jgi:hypothetical protein
MALRLVIYQRFYADRAAPWKFGGLSACLTNEKGDAWVIVVNHEAPA